MTKLALLVCDTPHPSVVSVYGAYPEIFTKLLESSSNTKGDWSLDSFDVVNKMEYPDLEKEQYEGIIITGSAASAYENLEWINRLVAWVAKALKEQPNVRFIGWSRAHGHCDFQICSHC